MQHRPNGRKSSQLNSAEWQEQRQAKGGRWGHVTGKGDLVQGPETYSTFSEAARPELRADTRTRSHLLRPTAL